MDKTSLLENHSTKISENVYLMIIAAITLMVLIYQLIYLTRFPIVFIDEPWYANAAWNWLKQGVNYDTMHAGAREDVIWPYIGNLPLVLSFATLGLGLFQARLVSWIFGVLLVLMTVLVGRKSFGNMTGFLAGLFLSIGPAFVQASHYARPDIVLAVVGVLCYFLALLAFENNRWWAHLLAGLFIGLAFDIHQNAILYALGLCALYIYNYRRKVLRNMGTWLFIFGGIAGVVYYVSIYVFPNPSDFLNYYRFSLGISHQMPLLTFNPINWLNSFRAEIGRYHFFEYSLDFAILGASFVYLALKPSKSGRLILIFTGTIFLGFVFLVGNKHDVYAILLYPFFMLIVAAALVGLANDSPLFRPQKAFVGVLIGLFIFSGVFRLARSVNENQNYDYDSITEQIKTVVSPEDKVMGLPNWWLGFSDYQYQSSIGLTYLHLIEGASLREGLEKLKPDIIILDTGLQGLLVNEGYYDPEGFEFFKLPRPEFLNFLSMHGEKLLEFSNPWHGSFEIYKINWDEQSS